MYPDQSLYPVDSVPKVIKRINNAFRRADQIEWMNTNGELTISVHPLNLICTSKGIVDTFDNLRH